MNECVLVLYPRPIFMMPVGIADNGIKNNILSKVRLGPAVLFNRCKDYCQVVICLPRSLFHVIKGQ